MFSITIIRGRLVEKPKLQVKKEDEKETVWTCYRLAVPRDWKVDGKTDVDFYSCVTFGKRAEYIARCGQKGTVILVSGRLQTDSYTNKNGTRIPVFQLVVEKQEICSGWEQSEKVPEREFTPAQDYPLMLPEEYLEEEYDLPI